MSDKRKIKMLWVPIAELFPNDYNPNKMSAEIYEKERGSIRTHGFIIPLLVRDREGGGYEIVDGEHRFLAAREEGYMELPVIPLGAIPDSVAKKLTIIANDLRGNSDPLKLASIVADLTKAEGDLELLIKELPYTRGELTTMLEVAAGDIDWSQYIKDEEGRRKGGKPAPSTHRFRLSDIHGAIMPSLARELVELYNADAGRLGSDSPDIVLADWLARLKATAPASPERSA